MKQKARHKFGYKTLDTVSELINKTYYITYFGKLQYSDFLILAFYLNIIVDKIKVNKSNHLRILINLLMGDFYNIKI